MIIEKITMFHVQLPMKFNFKTAKGSLNLRDTIIIKVESPNGLSGFGEAAGDLCASGPGGADGVWGHLYLSYGPARSRAPQHPACGGAVCG